MSAAATVPHDNYKKASGENPHSFQEILFQQPLAVNVSEGIIDDFLLGPYELQFCLWFCMGVQLGL
jgi:hypothetical protein